MADFCSQTFSGLFLSRRGGGAAALVTVSTVTFLELCDPEKSSKSFGVKVTSGIS